MRDDLHDPLNLLAVVFACKVGAFQNRFGSVGSLRHAISSHCLCLHVQAVFVCFRLRLGKLPPEVGDEDGGVGLANTLIAFIAYDYIE